MEFPESKTAKALAVNSALHTLTQELRAEGNTDLADKVAAFTFDIETYAKLFDFIKAAVP